jgi:hypothetical protein
MGGIGRSAETRRIMMYPARLLASWALVGVLLSSGLWAAEETKTITPENFTRLHKMIKPQRGESLFLEIPWVLSLWEGRQQAAREGKPMLVWAGGWGVPIGTC